MPCRFVYQDRRVAKGMTRRGSFKLPSNHGFCRHTDIPIPNGWDMTSQETPDLELSWSL